MKKILFTMSMVIAFLISCQVITDFSEDDSNNSNNSTNINNVNNVNNTTNNTTVESDCVDGIDNDNDGYTDCGDQDCNDDPNCIVVNNVNNQMGCSVEDAFSYGPESNMDCADNEICGLTYDLLSEGSNSEALLSIHVNGAMCRGFNGFNHYNQCSEDSDCPKMSMCIKDTCVPLAKIEDADPCGYTLSASGINLSPSWWISSVSNSDDNNRNFIVVDGPIVSMVPNLPLEYCFFEYNSMDNTGTGEFCDITSGDFSISGTDSIANHVCKVVIYDGGIIEPANGVQSFNSGVTPNFGDKKQGDLCLTTEECSSGHVCAKVTNLQSRPAQCRQICDTTAQCGDQSCSYINPLVDLVFTVGYGEFSREYGVCYGITETN